MNDVATSAATKAWTTTCPDCNGGVGLVGRLMIGEVCECGSCGVQLEVASMEPLTLELLAKVEEDEEDFIQ